MKNQLRPETGMMQFEDDAPGLFIRAEDIAKYGLLDLLKTEPQKAVMYGAGYRYCNERGMVKKESQHML